MTNNNDFKTAAERKIRSLYHYQSCDLSDEIRSEQFCDLLKHNRIYLSNPANFNDPWDCKPWFNTSLLDDPTQYRLHCDWAFRVWLKHNPGPHESGFLSHVEEKLKDRKFLQSHIDLISQSLHEEAAKRYRVYCLTTHPDNLLMWAHYANNHKGICIQYEVNSPEICAALEVQYSDAFPLYCLHDESIVGNLLPFLSKSASWAYENEYRLVAQESAASNEYSTLKTKDNLLSLSNGAIGSIIIGCQANAKSIADIIKSIRPDIPVQHAVRIPNKYALSIQPYVEQA